jgi:hypothetical protein
MPDPQIPSRLCLTSVDIAGGKTLTKDGKSAGGPDRLMGSGSIRQIERHPQTPAPALANIPSQVMSSMT